MDGNPNFAIISDFIVLTPLLLLLRAIYPRAITVQLSFTVVGLYAIYTVAPRLVPFFITFWLVIYALQWLMWAATRKMNGLSANVLTGIVIGLALSPMLIWKLWPGPFVEWTSQFFALVVWNTFPDFISIDAIATVAAPLGLSFVVFRALDLLIKVRLDLIAPLRPRELAYYAFFAPVLAVGPIIEYEEVRLSRVLSRLPEPSDVAIGLFRIAIGALKVLFIATLFNTIATNNWDSADPSFMEAWAALFAYALYFYINFSGYSDLAIGASRLHGLRLKENFSNPFLKTNPQAFWASWHMSLTRWCQRYVFVPLGGMRANRQYIAIFFTIMTIALWHGINWSMVIFGCYHAIFLIGHRLIENRRLRLKRPVASGFLPHGLKSLGVFIYQAIAFPMFAIPADRLLDFYSLFVPGL